MVIGSTALTARRPVAGGRALVLGSLHALACRANQAPTAVLVDPTTHKTISNLLDIFSLALSVREDSTAVRSIGHRIGPWPAARWELTQSRG